MRRAVSVAYVVVMTTFSVVMGPAAPASDAPQRAPLAEERLRGWVDDLRVANGLRTLRLDDDLARLARRNSRNMAETRTLHHTDLGGLLVTYVIAGENVGRDDTARAVHRVFLGSEYHADNMLRPTYRRIGVGAVRVDDDLYVTELFAGRKRQ